MKFYSLSTAYLLAGSVEGQQAQPAAEPCSLGADHFDFPGDKKNYNINIREKTIKGKSMKLADVTCKKPNPAKVDLGKGTDKDLDAYNEMKQAMKNKEQPRWGKFKCHKSGKKFVPYSKQFASEVGFCPDVDKWDEFKNNGFIPPVNSDEPEQTGNLGCLENGDQVIKQQIKSNGWKSYNYRIVQNENEWQVSCKPPSESVKFIHRKAYKAWLAAMEGTKYGTFQCDASGNLALAPDNEDLFECPAAGTWNKFWKDFQANMPEDEEDEPKPEGEDNLAEMIAEATEMIKRLEELASALAKFNDADKTPPKSAAFKANQQLAALIDSLVSMYEMKMRTGDKKNSGRSMKEEQLEQIFGAMELAEDLTTYVDLLKSFMKSDSPYRPLVNIVDAVTGSNSKDEDHPIRNGNGVKKALKAAKQNFDKMGEGKPDSGKDDAEMEGDKTEENETPAENGSESADNSAMLQDVADKLIEAFNSIDEKMDEFEDAPKLFAKKRIMREVINQLVGMVRVKFGKEDVETSSADQQTSTIEVDKLSKLEKMNVWSMVIDSIEESPLYQEFRQFSIAEDVEAVVTAIKAIADKFAGDDEGLKKEVGKLMITVNKAVKLMKDNKEKIDDFSFEENKQLRYNSFAWEPEPLDFWEANKSGTRASGACVLL